MPGIVNPAGAPPRKMSGRKLARFVKRVSTKDRLRLAHDIATGAVVIENPSFAQAAKLTNTSRSYVAQYAALDPAERAQFVRGEVTLRQLRQRRADDNEALDRIIARFGLARIIARQFGEAWTVFESLTAASCTNGKPADTQGPEL